MHQLVDMQATLHQQLAVALADELDAFRCSSLAVRHVDDLLPADVELVLGGDRRARAISQSFLV